MPLCRLVVLLILASAVLAAPARAQNPGACPAPTGPGICVELCSVDADCGSVQKCCSNACGHVCMDPVLAPSLNHFQCYDVRRQAFDDRTVSLVDDFGSSTAEVRQPKQLCAPVNKNGEDPTAPTDPDHLVGYQIRRDEPRFEEVRDELVEDQFGALMLDLRRPERLLVPSAKSLTDPATPLAPALVDHYQCYAVRGDRRRVDDVTLEDQFGTGTTDVKKPSRLCVPVDKDAEGILDGAARLLCYQIKSGPRVNETVYVDNQFGAGSLDVRRARELCVPVATPPPTATVTPTPTATPTPTVTATVTPVSPPTPTAPLCPAGGGGDVGPGRWYYGGTGQSCTTVCNNLGCACDEVTTRDYAGSAGTNGQCAAVLDAIGAPADPQGPAGSGCSDGRGCYFDQDAFTQQQIAIRDRCTDPVTTCSASRAGTRRACACVESPG